MPLRVNLKLYEAIIYLFFWLRHVGPWFPEQGSDLFPMCSFNPQIAREVPTGHHLRMIGFVFFKVQENCCCCC